MAVLRERFAGGGSSESLDVDAILSVSLGPVVSSEVMIGGGLELERPAGDPSPGDVGITGAEAEAFSEVGASTETAIVSV